MNRRGLLSFFGLAPLAPVAALSRTAPAGAGGITIIDQRTRGEPIVRVSDKGPELFIPSDSLRYRYGIKPKFAGRS